ncbi:lipopolysaccharide assembly protein LapA domain-containing protein [Streptococcaceae bacterium ESL0729]|nr:lipopolysaccharide assembly protein LapA domain-containing protein [Streptococcaceae bacterium ESL0729]
MMKDAKSFFTFKRVVALIIVVLVAVFALQNWKSVEVSLLFFAIKLPLIILILAMLAIGVFVGWVFEKSDFDHLVVNLEQETRKELDDIQTQLQNDKTAKKEAEAASQVADKAKEVKNDVNGAGDETNQPEDK